MSSRLSGEDSATEGLAGSSREHGDGHRVNRVDQGMIQIGGVSHTNIAYNNNSGPRHHPERTLIEALRFESIGQREQAVELAHGRTCEWLLDTEEYLRWMDSDRTGSPEDRLLWIKGKAGTGKSTMMKFAIANASQSPAAVETGSGGWNLTERLLAVLWRREARPEPDLILSHFFNARGNALERSTEGMYRTLLIQLLKALDSMPELLSRLPRHYIPPPESPWPLPSLITFLKAAVRGLGGRPIVFFVDALDECKGDEVRDMVHVFESLIDEAASCQQVLRVCFASRPHPHIQATSVIYLELSKRGEHLADIKEYVDDRLRIGKGAKADYFRQQILEKSDGVFLWVVLVVGRLNYEYSRAREERYDKWLKGSHGGLNDLYREMLDREGDGEAEDDEALAEEEAARVACFQWMSFGYWELKPWELWLAIQLSIKREVKDIHRSYEEMDDEMVDRYISSTSRGMVECVVGGSGDEFRTVQFIHESAREFAMSKDGLMRMMAANNIDEVAMRSHEALKRCCEKVLDAVAEAGRNVDDYSSIWEGLMNEHPLLDYASQNILQHANEAQQRQQQRPVPETSLEQGAWLAEKWHNPEFWSVLQRVWIDRFGDEANTLVDVLVWDGCKALMQADVLRPVLLEDMREARCQHRTPGVRFGWGYSPVLEALLRDNLEAVRWLLTLYLDLEPRHELVQAALEHLASTPKPDGRPQSDSDMTGLDIADFSDGLATFFLLALAPSHAFNDQNARMLPQHSDLDFPATLRFFYHHDLPTDLFQDNERTATRHLQWAEEHGHLALAATLRLRGTRSLTPSLSPSPSP